MLIKDLIHKLKATLVVYGNVDVKIPYDEGGYYTIKNVETKLYSEVYPDLVSSEDNEDNDCFTVLS